MLLLQILLGVLAVVVAFFVAFFALIGVLHFTRGLPLRRVRAPGDADGPPRSTQEPDAACGRFSAIQL